MEPDTDYWDPTTTVATPTVAAVPLLAAAVGLEPLDDEDDDGVDPPPPPPPHAASARNRPSIGPHSSFLMRFMTLFPPAGCLGCPA